MHTAIDKEIIDKEASNTETRNIVPFDIEESSFPLNMNILILSSEWSNFQVPKEVLKPYVINLHLLKYKFKCPYDLAVSYFRFRSSSYAVSACVTIIASEGSSSISHISFSALITSITLSLKLN